MVISRKWSIDRTIAIFFAIEYTFGNKPKKNNYQEKGLMIKLNNSYCNTADPNRTENCLHQINTRLLAV